MNPWPWWPAPNCAVACWRWSCPGWRRRAWPCPAARARSLPPPLPEVYELIAETWARSLVTPAPEHLVVLEEGVRYFPRNAALVHATAVQKVRIGLVADAHALIALGLRVAPTPEFRAKFETLNAALPPAPPAPVPATKAKKS